MDRSEPLIRDKNLSIEQPKKNSSRDAKPSFFLVCSSLVRRWPRLMDAFQGRSRRRCKQRFSIWSTCRQIVAEHDWGRPERAEGTRNIDETQKSLHLTPDILSKIIGFLSNRLGISLFRPVGRKTSEIRTTRETRETQTDL